MRRRSFQPDPFGEKPHYVRDEADMDCVRLSYEKTAPDSENALDEITWSDLNLDNVYARIAGTLSSAGDGVLYAMLRQPLTDWTAIARRHAASETLCADPKRREKLRSLLHRLGHDWRLRWGVLLGEDVSPSRGRLIRLCAQSAFVLAAALLLALGYSWAILPLLLLVLGNVVTSEWYNHKMHGQIPTAIWLLKLLVCGRGLQDQLGDCEESRALRKALEELEDFRGAPFLSLFFSEDALTLLFKSLLLLQPIYYERFLFDLAKKKEAFLRLYRAVGEIDALIAIGSYRMWSGISCAPEKAETLSFTDLHHPLVDGCVPNSTDIPRCLLLTGSNASGKSTFLRAVALGAILAQSITVCPATRWQGPAFYVMSSLALRDSVLNGESYFMAEVRALRRMLDYRGKARLMALVDEVLRGTNTGERISAAWAALSELAESNALCLAATHDGELCSLLEGMYDNAHFTETFQENDMAFDYKLRPGPARTQNALLLIRHMGGYQLAEKAEKMLSHYRASGKWEKPE